MKCNYCGKENNDEVNFCVYCGKKIEKKMYCGWCGKEVPGNQMFCGFCGTKVNDTSSEGLSASEPSERKSSDSVSAKQSFGFASSYAYKSNFDARKTEKKQDDYMAPAEKVMFALTIFGSLALIVFVWFIGIIIKSGMQSDYSETAVGIIDFFGRIYSDLAKLFENFKASQYYMLSQYFPYVISTIVYALTALATCILAVRAMCGAVKRLLHIKTYIDAGNCFAFAYLIYLVGSLIIYAMFWSEPVNTTEFQSSVSLNATTISGFVICGACLAVFVVFGILMRTDKLSQGKEITRFVFSLGGLVFSVLAMVFLFLPAYETDISAFSTRGHIGYVGLLKTMGSMLFDANTVVKADTIELFSFMNIGSVLFLILSGMCLILIIAKAIKSLTNDENNATVTYEICMSVLAVILLVASIIAGICASNDIKVLRDTEVLITCINTVIFFVFSLLICASSIVYKVLDNSNIFTPLRGGNN